jgi:hypothetical protein
MRVNFAAGGEAGADLGGFVVNSNIAGRMIAWMVRP